MCLSRCVVIERTAKEDMWLILLLALQPTLNAFAALGSEARTKVRAAVQALFSAGSEHRFDDSLRQRAVHDIRSVKMHLPMQVPDFVDFSVYPAHGLGAGRAIFGPDTPLPPSFSRLPMAYNGRAGTVTTNEQIVRPQGQTRAFSAQREIGIGASKALDWEFEIVSRLLNELSRKRTR